MLCRFTCRSGSGYETIMIDLIRIQGHCIKQAYFLFLPLDRDSASLHYPKLETEAPGSATAWSAGATLMNRSPEIAGVKTLLSCQGSPYDFMRE